MLKKLFQKKTGVCSASVPDSIAVCGHDIAALVFSIFQKNVLKDIFYTGKHFKGSLTYSVDTEFINSLSFDKIAQFIVDEYGIELFKMFCLHANGLSYSDLSKLTHIYNLKTKFQKIRKSVLDFKNI